MTLLDMLWVAHLPAALAVLSYGVPAIVPIVPEAVASDSRWPFSAASVTESVASSPTPAPVPPAPLHSLGGTDRWNLQAAVDWQRWKNTATVTVVETSSAEATDSPSGRQPQDFLPASCPAAHPHHPGAQALDLATVPAATNPAMDEADSTDEARFVIRVKGVAIGQVVSAAEAEAVAVDLRQAMPTLSQRPQDLSPKVEGHTGMGQLQGQAVFSLSPETIQEEE